MSLKAKLEAVIYAAEEPVTLAQFAVLFANDAFAWKSEREARNLELALSVEQAIEAAGDGIADSTRELVELVEMVENPPGSQSERPAEEGLAEGAASSRGAASPEELAVDSEREPDPELEARRQARARDREAKEILRGILAELIADCAADSRGIEIREIAGGYRMATKPEMHDAVRAFVKSQKPPMKLSLPALETLAVIAYKQPVTAPEVGEIRGVDSAGVLGSLMSRKLIATAGRKPVVGRPMLYKTTREFLLRFGLKDIHELPSMEEFEKMAALELNEESLHEESLDGEAREASEAVEQPGELFAREELAASMAEQEPGAEPKDPPGASNRVITETFTPTAEPSREEAEAHASVERHTEEIEVEP